MRCAILVLSAWLTACGPHGGAAAPVDTAPDPASPSHPPADRCPLLGGCSETGADSCPDPFFEFRSGSAELQPLTIGLLEDLAAEIKAHERVRGLRLEGHAGAGEDESLAGQRADAVRGFLVDSGISAAMLEVASQTSPDQDDTYVTVDVVDCAATSAADDSEGSSLGAVDIVLQ